MDATGWPRIAYFPDSFHEVNGVAHTSRNFAAYAKRRGLPFLCVRASAGHDTPELVAAQEEEMRTLDLRRSLIAVRLEKDLEFDPLFWRYNDLIEQHLVAFRPDVIHITGPSELGIFGAYFAWKLGVRLAASWHTNLHQYSARRLAWLTSRMPAQAGARLEDRVEAASLATILRFYRLARVLFAPNPELCAMLEARTGKRCHLMRRGVDTEMFRPERRTRSHADGRFVLGYVGRLSIEKNVALLLQIQRELDNMGVQGVEFSIVGHGSEQPLLQRELRRAHFAGVLRGDALAGAYADMDLLIFPSHTDTFGNVVLEALASGVPALVSPDGGPKFMIRDGETGFVVPDGQFSAAAASLAGDPARLQRMRAAARAYAAQCSWDSVFDAVLAGYSQGLRECATDGVAATPKGRAAARVPAGCPPDR